MAIKDLLKNIGDKEIKTCSVADFKGMSVAIDASSWLQKAMFSLAEDMIDHDFQDHMFYVDFLLYRTRNFRIAGVEPVMVFESGRRSGLKSDAHQKVEEARDASLEQGKRLLESLRSTSDAGCQMKLRSEALACFQRGLKVTKDIETRCISALKRVGVTVIVAPFEADAQMAYLCHIGMCRAVLTEDSDLIVYSAICGTPFPILYKFEGSGTVQAISLRTLGIFESTTDKRDSCSPPSVPATPCADSAAGKDSFTASLRTHFSGKHGRRMFVQMCILAGCDYSESVRGVDLIAAQQACIQSRGVPDDSRLVRIVRQFENSKYSIRTGYLEKAIRAEALFYYHPVYDPTTRSITNFSPPNLMACCSGLTPPSSPSGDDSSPTHSTTSVSSCVSPLIAEAELLKLGSADHVLSLAPPGIRIRDLCEGKYSFGEFEEIQPLLPWERPEVRALARPIGPSSGPPAVPPRSKNNCWLNRSHLMKMLSGIESGSPSPTSRPAGTSFPASQASFQPSAEAVSTNVQTLIPSIQIQQEAAPSSLVYGQRGNRCVSSVPTGSMPSPSRLPTASSEAEGKLSEDSFHTPPSNSSQMAAQKAELVLSPQHSRLACADEASSPEVASPSSDDRRLQYDKERSRGSKEASRDSDEVILRSKRKMIDAVAVPASSSKTNAKGKKQKTLMVASIKSYFSMPR